VALNHPPINTVDDLMYDQIYDLVEEIGEEPSLKVVTFESANPAFFLSHYGIAESSSRFGKPRWIEAAIRLAQSSVLSIAVIRGRVRAGGDEFALACDIRFASRERAVFFLSTSRLSRPPRRSSITSDFPKRQSLRGQSSDQLNRLSVGLERGRRRSSAWPNPGKSASAFLESLNSTSAGRSENCNCAQVQWRNRL
jgi:hypothetical protein